ncbi:MAG: hypothetical protein ACLP0J_00810 [Solirubrobacteraceae bacterium]
MSVEPRSVCSPCRGTGMLTSSKGGNPHAVVCPWCGGSGRFQPGRDAQAVGGAGAGGGATDGASGEDRPSA